MPDTFDTDINPGKEYSGPVPDLQQIRARLEQLTTDTGGSITYPKTPAEVVPMFLEIGKDLGVSYSLGFVPTKPTDNKPHRIEIRTRGEEGYKVHQSRDSYIAK